MFVYLYDSLCRLESYLWFYDLMLKIYDSSWAKYNPAQHISYNTIISISGYQENRLHTQCGIALKSKSGSTTMCSPFPHIQPSPYPCIRYHLCPSPCLSLDLPDWHWVVSYLVYLSGIFQTTNPAGKVCLRWLLAKQRDKEICFESVSWAPYVLQAIHEYLR